MSTPAPSPEPVRIASETDLHLEQLCALRTELSEQLAAIAPQYDHLTAQLKLVNDSLKVKLASMVPGAPSVQLTSPHLIRPLTLHARTRYGLADGKRFEAEQPGLFSLYGKKSAYYELREAGTAQ